MRRYLLLGIALVAVGSCSPTGNDGTGPSETVASVAVAPALDTVYIGAVSQLVATPRNSDGTVLAGKTVTWDQTGTGATVSGTGLVSGVSTGEATVTATSEGISGTAAIVVRPVPVVSVLVTRATDTIYLGATAQFTAVARDSVNGILAGRTITWTALDAAASVSAAGLVTSQALGTARIVATSEGKADTTLVSVLLVPVASVVVTPAADTLYPTNTVQLAAVTRDSANGALAGRTVTWSALDAAATVNGTGLVTAAAVGAARIVATSEGKADTAVITVLTVPVASVTVTPAADTLYPTNTVQLVAVTRDSANGVLAGRVVNWASLDGAATVTGTGLVTAAAPGTGRIVATSEGKADTAVITVVPVPVAAVTLSPDSARVNAGATVQFTATPRDSAGGALAGRVVTWMTLDSAVATVSGDGLLTGVAVGSTSMIALSEGKGDTALVVVDTLPTPLPPLTGTWVGSGVSSLHGEFSIVVVFDQTDSVLGGNWAGGQNDAGAITGTVTGTSAVIHALGANNGTCTSDWTATRVGGDSLNGSFQFSGVGCPISSNNGPLSAHRAPTTASIVITSDIDSALVGDTAQLAAEARDSTGGVLAGRPIRWSSSDTTIVTITPDGFAEAKAPGSAVLIASGQGKADTAQLIVLPVAPTVPPLTGTWTGGGNQTNDPPFYTFDLLVRFTQIGDSLTGDWESGESDEGSLTGTVTDSSVTAVLFGANGGTCDVQWTAARIGADSMDGTFQFTGGACPIPTNSGTLDVHRSAATAAIIITSDIDSATVGDVRQVVAEARDSTGAMLTARQIRWSSSDTTIVSITPGGLGEALAPGVVLLIASGQGKADTAQLVVVDTTGGGGGGPSLTGIWSLSIDSAPHDLTLTLTQTGDSISGSWQGVGASDTGQVAGSVNGNAVSITIFNANAPAADCDVIWTANRFGPDSLAGSYLFARAGCPMLGQSGTLGGHRGGGGSGGPEVIGPFDISVTAGGEWGQGSASDGTNALTVYQWRPSPGAPNTIRARLADSAGNLVATEIDLGIHGDPPAAAYGGGVYLTAFWGGGTDSIVAQLISTAGALVGGPIPVHVGPGAFQVCGLAYGASTFYITYNRASGSVDTSGNDLYRLYGRPISTAGAVGAEVQVSDGFGECTTVTGQLASDGSGFLGVWRQMDSLPGSGATLKSRTLTSGGSLGAVHTVATTSGPVFGQSLAYRAGGGWVTAWNEALDTLMNMASYQRVLAADGSVTGGVTTISSGSPPTLGFVAEWSGGWVTIWSDRPASAADTRTRIRFYDAGGIAVGSDLEIGAMDFAGKIPLSMFGATEGSGAIFVALNFYTPGVGFVPDEFTGDLRGVWVRP